LGFWWRHVRFVGPALPGPILVAIFAQSGLNTLKVYTLMEYEGKEKKMQLGFAWKAFADFFQSLGMSPSNFTTIKFPLANQGDSPNSDSSIFPESLKSETPS